MHLIKEGFWLFKNKMGKRFKQKSARGGTYLDLGHCYNLVGLEAEAKLSN